MQTTTNSEQFACVLQPLTHSLVPRYSPNTSRHCLSIQIVRMSSPLFVIPATLLSMFPYTNIPFRDLFTTLLPRGIIISYRTHHLKRTHVTSQLQPIPSAFQLVNKRSLTSKSRCHLSMSLI